MAMTDSVIQKLIENEWGCQWIGPEQDPRDGPVTYCGCKVIPGKAYCPEHYDRMYIKGSALTRRRSASLLQKSNSMTREEVEDLFNEIIAELEEEGAL
jgi:hypothetical protein